MKNNQTVSSGRGGARPGAGRKKGTPNKRTQEIQQAVEASGLSPLDYLLQVMRDESAEEVRRIDAAKAAAPYVHAKLSSVELTGKDGGAVETVSRIELIGVAPDGDSAA